MKVKLLYSSAILGLGLMALASFSGGATGGAGDRTGSPLSSGTCEGCHSSAGSFAPIINVMFLNTNFTPVATPSYTPGQTYLIRMVVAAPPVGGSAPQYGAQFTALDGNNNMAGAFTQAVAGPGTGSTGAQLTTINNITYLEHSFRSLDGMFGALWTAPPSGTGDVTIYAAGLAVNNNGSTSGDNYINTTFTLSEDGTTPVSTINKQALDYNVYPNPATDGQFFIDGVNGDANIAVRDIAGRVVYQVNTSIQNTHEVNLQQLPKGIYTVTVTQDNKVGTQKVIL